jgi:hypothetical protein
VIEGNSVSIAVQGPLLSAFAKRKQWTKNCRFSIPTPKRLPVWLSEFRTSFLVRKIDSGPAVRFELLNVLPAPAALHQSLPSPTSTTNDPAPAPSPIGRNYPQKASQFPMKSPTSPLAFSDTPRRPEQNEICCCGKIEKRRH